MEVLHVNTTDVRGGAGRAAYRLHSELNRQAVDSRMLVRYKFSTADDVEQYGSSLGAKLTAKLDNAPLVRYRDRSSSPFSVNWMPGRLVDRINDASPDVVHLHWIGKGFLRIEDVEKIAAPVVWTLHDMWPFTGGCHYSLECERYRDSCGDCPQLGGTKEADLSRRIWSRKEGAWNRAEITFVAPSTWIAECARKSGLVESQDVEVLPNGIDLDEYSPEQSAGYQLDDDLDDDRPILLFGAMSATSDPRKGFDELVSAVEQLAETDLTDNLQAAVFGASEGPELPTGIDITFLGQVPDDELPSLYATADVMVVPSRQDNLPNTVLEALACGTPVVAFDVGGIGNMVEHETNGYLAEPRNEADLARGIRWAISEECDHGQLSEVARRTVKDSFGLSDTTSEFVSLYRRVASRDTQN